MVLWVFEMLLLTSVDQRPPAHVYISVSMYINLTFLSFKPKNIISTFDGLYRTLRWLCIGTQGRPSLSAFIFVYKGSITKNVYRDEIKWAQTAWKAITCVGMCVCECMWHSVCGQLLNTSVSVFTYRMKVANKQQLKLQEWEFILPPWRAEVMMHGAINCKVFGEGLLWPRLKLYRFSSHWIF